MPLPLRLLMASTTNYQTGCQSYLEHLSERTLDTIRTVAGSNRLLMNEVSDRKKLSYFVLSHGVA
jgi:hypothetical protein